MRNVVRQLRTSQGLTQRQLARAVGTSQQQIQRIESGKQSVRFDLASRIASALDASLAQVFPEAAVPLRRSRRRPVRPTWEDPLSDPRARENLEQADLDLDPELWFLKCRLRGGVECVFHVSGPDKHRLWSAVQRGHPERFVIFESEAHAVVLNLDHLLLAHFLFEVPSSIREETDSDADSGLSVLFAGETDFQTFDVDADEAEPENEADEDPGQLRNLLFEAELSTEPNDVLHFTDVDGETVFLRAADVAVIQVPLWAIHPEMDVDEDQDAADEER